jgi:hypothetical protein
MDGGDWILGARFQVLPMAWRQFLPQRHSRRDSFLSPAPSELRQSTNGRQAPHRPPLRLGPHTRPAPPPLRRNRRYLFLLLSPCLIFSSIPLRLIVSLHLLN